MAQIRSLMELADRSFVIAFRFYGRYPETGRTFYHPPPCEIDPEAASINSPLGSRRYSLSSSASRLSLSVATSLILPTFSASSFSVLFSNGTQQDLRQNSSISSASERKGSLILHQHRL